MQNRIDFLEKHILELSLSPDHIVAENEQDDDITYEEEGGEI